MPDSTQPELHFELWILEPYGAAFLLCLCDENDVIASFVLAPRYGRLLSVLEGAANERARAEQWRGFLSATTVGERYATLSHSDTPLEVQGVRALVCELRRMVKGNFAQASRAGRDGLPPIIETRTMVGYRVGASFKTVRVR